MPLDKLNIDDIYFTALKKADGEERAAYLDEACGEDSELRDRVERLLSAQPKVGSFLESPAPGIDLSRTELQPITEKTGTQIGPYKLLQRVGEGGMGVVYMAEQKEPVKRRVALKIIKPGMDTRQVIARFEAERQALAMMDHPNIAKVLDAGQTDSGRPYFVMELIKGVPVTQYCDEQHLNPKERLELFVPICQAVQHAHQKGIIHRDIKPSNILIALFDGQPVPKVIDFGVAKATSQTLTEKTMFTQLGQVVGTLEYMSPEQAQVNQLDIDTRSDIYSLGVVLYELLTGETPFDRARLRSAAFDEMLRIIREEEPSKPSTKVSNSETLASTAANRRIHAHKLGSTIRGELDWIVMKALEKDRARRYETASRFAEDVLHYLNDEAVAACPPSRVYRFRKLVRRHRTGVGVAALVTLLLVAGIAGTSWKAYEADRERGRALSAEKLAQQRFTEEQKARKRAEQAEQNAKQQTARAEGEAAAAYEMFLFLSRDLLALSGSDQQAEQGLAPDPDLKVRTLLDRAAAKIEGRFEQPRVEVALRRTIGSAYLGVDATDEAEKHLKRALELSRQHSVEATAILRDLSRLYKMQMRLEEAAELGKEVYETCRRTRGDENDETLRAMDDLAGTYMLQKKYPEAESLFSRRIEILRVSSNEDDVDLMKSEHNLATTYLLQGQHAKAAMLFSNLLDRRKRSLPAEHGDILRNQLALGSAYKSLGQYEKAELLLRDTATVMRRTRGEHFNTLAAEQQLAEILALQKRFEEAIELDKASLNACELRYGRDDPRSVAFRRHLASMYADAAQHLASHSGGGNLSQDEIIDLAQQAVALTQTAHHRAILGLVHTRFEQWEAAAKIFENIARDRPQRLGPYGFAAALAYWKTGRRELALQQYAVSRELVDAGRVKVDETIHHWQQAAEKVISADAQGADGERDLQAIDEERSPKKK